MATIRQEKSQNESRKRVNQFLGSYDEPSLIYDKNYFANARLSCSSSVDGKELLYGFTAVKEFFYYSNRLKTISSNFLHDQKTFHLIFDSTNNFYMKINYSSMARLNFEITQKNMGKEFNTMLTIIVNHTPLFFEKVDKNDRIQHFSEECDSSKKYDPWYYLCRATAFQVSFSLKKEEMDSLFYQLYELTSCSITYGKMEQRTIDLKNLNDLDNETSHWPWDIQYYLEVIKSCGIVGSYLLYEDLLRNNNIELLKNKNGSYSKGAPKNYFESMYEHLKSDISLASLDFNREVASSRNDSSNDCMSIRMAYITPTRIIFNFEETTTSSRGIRFLGIENLILVKFCDDNFGEFPRTSLSRNKNENVIHKCCMDGILVGGQRFYEFGCSNSLFREHGTYFYKTENKKEIPRLWKSLGEFKIEPASKVAARIGQYFTSARMFEKLNQKYVQLIPDFMSTSVDASGKPYCFSDGVGIISRSYAEKIRKILDIPFLPSAFQIRYAGYKGLVSIDDYDPRLIDNGGPYLVCFRDSQKKFTVNGTDDLDFDIARWSDASPAKLHNIFIAMLDELARNQGKEKALRDRLHELLRASFNSILEPLIEYNAFIEKLDKLPKYIPVKELKSKNLLDEPFWRAIIEVDAVLAVRKLLKKNNIHIPPSLGRQALGIVDTTGKLKEGEIFFKYSKNIPIKSNVREKIILKNIKVGITKSPIYHLGDIRYLTAVDVPELHYLCDVLVFPQRGSRPHPDEIGGGDLDGDSYIIFWENSWIFEHATASDFTAPNSDKLEKVTLNELQEKFVDFRSEYAAKNNVSHLSTSLMSHLILHDSMQPDCKIISKKADIAVNFFKSGIDATPLKENEKPGLVPKCLAKPHEPAFTNSHILNQLYERSKIFYHLISIAQKEAQKRQDETRPQICKTAFLQEDEEVRREFNEYKTKIHEVMTKYQIHSEAELFSDSFLDDIDGFKSKKAINSYSIAQVIKSKVSTIFKEYRIKILNKFDKNWKVNMEKLQETIFTYTIPTVSSSMILLAEKYYKIAKNDGTCLSFPWVIWEGIDKWWLKENIPISSVSKKLLLGFEAEQNYDRFKSSVDEIISQLKEKEEIYKSYYQHFESFIAIVKAWIVCEKLKQNEVVLYLKQFLQQLELTGNFENRRTCGTAFMDFLKFLGNDNFETFYINACTDKKQLQKAALSTLIKYAFFPEDKISDGIHLQQQIINYPSYVISVPEKLVEIFEKNYKQLESKSGCNEIAIGFTKKAFTHNHFTIMCRGTMESCQKLESMLTPVIEPNNTISLKKMKEKKYEIMEALLTKLFSRSNENSEVQRNVMDVKVKPEQRTQKQETVFPVNSNIPVTNVSNPQIVPWHQQRLVQNRYPLKIPPIQGASNLNSNSPNMNPNIRSRYPRYPSQQR